MMNDTERLKLRCFDAETARDDANSRAEYFNGVLTQVANQLGVMMEDAGNSVYNPQDILNKIEELTTNNFIIPTEDA